MLSCAYDGSAPEAVQGDSPCPQREPRGAGQRREPVRRQPTPAGDGAAAGRAAPGSQQTAAGGDRGGAPVQRVLPGHPAAQAGAGRGAGPVAGPGAGPGAGGGDLLGGPVGHVAAGGRAIPADEGSGAAGGVPASRADLRRGAGRPGRPGAGQLPGIQQGDDGDPLAQGAHDGGGGAVASAGREGGSEFGGPGAQGLRGLRRRSPRRP